MTRGAGQCCVAVGTGRGRVGQGSAAGKVPAAGGRAEQSRAVVMGCAAVLWGWFLLGCSWGPGPPGVGAAALLTATYVLDDAGGLGRQFDGIGAISGGGVSGGGRGGCSGAGVLIPSSRRRL